MTFGQKQHIKRPEDMTFKDALIKLFPQQSDNIAKTGKVRLQKWGFWRIPKQSIQIDREVEILLNINALRSRDELERLDIKCPFLFARLHVASAADAGQYVINKNIERLAQINRLKEFERKSKCIIAQYDELRIFLHPLDLEPYYEIGLDRKDFDAINATSQDVLELYLHADKGIKSLGELALLAKKECDRKPPPRKDKDMWSFAFIESLGHTWHILTGSNPVSSDLFLRFIQASYESLETPGAEQEKAWSQVRPAIERIIGNTNKTGRPWWDRFDRTERDLPVPGEIRFSIEDWIEQQRRRPTARDAAMRDLARELKKSGRASFITSLFGRYKGYLAAVEFQADDQLWAGRLDGISDIIGFHAEKLEDLEVVFREAVDDYLETCRKFGKEPNVPKNLEP